MPSNISDTNSKSGSKRLVKVVGVCLFAIAIAICALWLYRPNLAEWAARKSLAEQNIQASLSIKSITGSGVVIEDLRLSHSGSVFFTAERVTAEYDWRTVLKKKVSRVAIKAPQLSITVNESGQITDAWMPQSQGGSDIMTMFPKDGIRIDSARIDATTPYGQIPAAFNADIVSSDKITGDIQISKTQVSNAEFAGDIALNASGQLAGNDITAEFSIRSDQAQYLAYAAAELELTGTTAIKKDAPLDGVFMDAVLRLASASTPDMSIGPSRLSWEGTLSAPSSENTLPDAQGEWAASIKSARLDNEARRLRLARSVTLYDTMSDLSSTAPLAPQLLAIADDLLSQSDIIAKGKLSLDDSGARVQLMEIAAVNAANHTLNVTPARAGDFFIYRRNDPAFTFNFGASLKGLKSIILSGATLLAKPTGDQNISNIQNFAAQVTTEEPWRAVTAEGRPVRLAPIKARINYDAARPERVTTMTGAIDFDGDIPGGYAAGIQADGTLVLRTTADKLTASFTPKKGQPIQIARVETVTDWWVENAVFNVSAGGPVYRRTAQSAALSAQVTMGSGRLKHRNEPQYFDVTFGAADVSAQISDVRQDWTINAEKPRLTSDNFPSPGTDISAPSALITAGLTPDGSPEFTISSPNTNVKTQLVSAAGLGVTASGTPDDIKAVYSEGRIKFAAGELPVLPLSGEIFYQDGRWTGTAETYLPRAVTTPIEIAYVFENGIGTADVTFDDLAFKPLGLQPKHLVSALSGKISRVDSLVSSKIRLSFGADQPLQSSGTALIRNMSFSTLPGPVSGMNAELTFSSFFPLETAGVQTLTVRNFDPGFPLENGSVEFEIIPEGLRLHSANWPLGGGRLSLDPTIWRYNAVQNRVVFRADTISLGEFFKNVGGGRFQATGDVTGVLPVVIEGVKVNVDNGSLAVKNGGVIQYSSPQTNQAGAANPVAGYAFNALKNFEYEELEATLNGPLDGPMRLKMLFSGSNPEVLAGSEFKFNVGIEGELMNIMRSFKVGQDISAKILEQVQTPRPQSNPPEP